MTRAKRRLDLDQAEPVLEGLAAESLVSFAGEWVAYADGRILAHGERLMDVLAAVRRMDAGSSVRYLPVPSVTGAY